MTVPAPPELQQFVEESVRSGRFESEEQVVSRALQLLQSSKQARTQHLDSFRTELDARLASLDRGEHLDGEQVFEELPGRRPSAD